MVALFLCQNADFMFDILETHIAASYGMDRLTSEQYKKVQEEDILTPDQEEAQHLPGPFSYAEYVGALLDESFWGDHGVLLPFPWCGKLPLLHWLLRPLLKVGFIITEGWQM